MLEKPGLLQPDPEEPTTNMLHPADVYLPSWTFGAPAALDFAVTSPQRAEVLAEASRSAGAAARAYESFKRGYLDTEADCRRQGITFIPMIAETSGGWSENAAKVFKSIAHAGSLRTGGNPRAIAERYFQNLSVSIRRANACATLRRHAGVEELAALRRSWWPPWRSLELMACYLVP